MEQSTTNPPASGTEKDEMELAPQYKSKNYLSNGDPPRIGPHPGHIQVSHRFYDEDEIQSRKKFLGVTEGNDIVARMNGVTWIDEVRMKLKMPVETYNTAVLWFNRFRLTYRDDQYDFRDAAAAALFLAGKIEDTLKKSRDILCTAHNLRIASGDHRTPDDPMFDGHTKIIIGLERLMLEANSFDFRTRHPNMYLIRTCKSAGLGREGAPKAAWEACIDIFRTWAPIKHTRQTIALACIEFGCRLYDIPMSEVKPTKGIEAENRHSSREEVLEALMDLLELYTQQRTSTRVGPKYADKLYLDMLIACNKELEERGFNRYCSLAAYRLKEGQTEIPGLAEHFPNAPAGVGERGKDGTVRFMLSPRDAAEERDIIKEYFDDSKLDDSKSEDPKPEEPKFSYKYDTLP